MLQVIQWEYGYAEHKVDDGHWEAGGRWRAGRTECRADDSASQ